MFLRISSDFQHIYQAPFLAEDLRKTIERSGARVFGRRGACVFGERGARVFGRRGACVFGERGARVFGRRGACVFGERGARVFGRRACFCCGTFDFIEALHQ